MSLNVNMQDMWDEITEQAQQLEKAERCGQSLKDFDFAVMDQCMHCMNLIIATPKRCSECKAVLYCGRECQKWAWSKPKFPGQLPHRGLCAANKRHMLRIPEAHAILTSFPWGRLESDYTFSFDLARGRFKVLGGSGMGYWSQRGGPVAHTNNGDAHDEYKKHQPQRLLKYNQEFKHVDGYDLLHRVGHLTDAQGWKLSPELIPYRDLDEIQDEQHPVLVTEFEGGVKDWDSWYRWRRLPKRSPAALLMNYPLSVYHLVVDMLRLTRPEKGKSDKRVRLCVHMIGAEVELNYLPLFSELALLLPYHDITLLLWGQSVHDLLAEAATRGAEGSPAWDALAKNGLIFSYAAPDKLGGGTIKIILSRVSPMWNAQSQKILSDAAPELTPDALVALNAGLGAYRSWMEVIHVAHLLDIPFAVTEYTEQSLEHVVREQLPTVMPDSSGAVRMHSFGLNPFHRPGQRPIPHIKLPNLVNGFTMVVVESRG